MKIVLGPSGEGDLLEVVLSTRIALQQAAVHVSWLNTLQLVIVRAHETPGISPRFEFSIHSAIQVEVVCRTYVV